MTTAGEPHLDLVPDADAGANLPDAASNGAPNGWLAMPDAGAPAPDTREAPVPDLEAERDKWRERAVVWRERALASELLAKELAAHLNDVKENLEDVRLALRELTDRRSLAAPRTGWRAYVARLLDLDR